MSTEFQFYWLKRVLAMGGDDIISNTTKLYTSFFFFDHATRFVGS